MSLWVRISFACRWEKLQIILAGMPAIEAKPTGSLRVCISVWDEEIKRTFMSNLWSKKPVIPEESATWLSLFYSCYFLKPITCNIALGKQLNVATRCVCRFGTVLQLYRDLCLWFCASIKTKQSKTKQNLESKECFGKADFFIQRMFWEIYRSSIFIWFRGYLKKITLGQLSV